MPFKIIKKMFLYLRGKSQNRYLYIFFCIVITIFASLILLRVLKDNKMQSLQKDINSKSKKIKTVEVKKSISRVNIDISEFFVKDRTCILNLTKTILYVGENKAQIENGYFDISLNKNKTDNKISICLVKLWHGEYKEEYKNYIDDNYLEDIVDALINVQVLKKDEKQEFQKYLYNTYVDYINKKEYFKKYKENKAEAKIIENILFVDFNNEED